MTKKELERRYRDRFRECREDFPEGRIVDEESPDFLVHTADGILGIEPTQMYHPAVGDAPPMQAHESLEDRIIEQAHELYNRGGGPPLIVHINFVSPLRLNRDAATALASELATLVRTSMPVGTGSVQLQNRWPTDPLPDEVIEPPSSRGHCGQHRERGFSGRFAFRRAAGN